MKLQTFNIITILFFFIGNVQGMNVSLDTIPENEALQLEEMPYFSGCEGIEDLDERKRCSNKKIIAFINSNVQYPELARENGVEGTAVIQFIVEKDGSLSFEENPILKNPGVGTGKEALRVIRSMPNWIPGKIDGRPVRTILTVPVKFKLLTRREIKQQRKNRKKKR